MSYVHSVTIIIRQGGVRLGLTASISDLLLCRPRTFPQCTGDGQYDFGLYTSLTKCWLAIPDTQWRQWGAVWCGPNTISTKKRGNCECIATWNRPSHGSPFPL